MATIMVTNLNDNGAGSLRQAILDANSGDTINFDPGLAGGTLVLTSGELNITQSVTIDGFTNANGTPDLTIDAVGQSRVFDLTAGSISARFDGLVMANGYAAAGGNGGAIDTAQGDVVYVSNSRLTDNSAGGKGGAIFVAGFGGGLVLLNSTIDHNYAAVGGGGIYGNLATLNIANSTLSGNSTGPLGVGGGVYDHSTALNLYNATLAGNSAYAGGGIENTGTLYAYDSTLTGNLAHTTGGIDSAAGDLTLINSIAAGNHGQHNDDISGGNLYFRGNNVLGSSPAAGSINTSKGSYIQIDPTKELGKVFGSLGYNPDTGVFSGVLADNGGPIKTVAINPFGTAAGVTYNAGSNAALPPDRLDLNTNGNITEPLPVDARGFSRVVGGTVDIGAFEQQQGTAFVVTTLADNPYDGKTLAQELAEGNGLSLRQAIGLANQDRTTNDVITFASDLIGGNTHGVNDGVLLLTNGELTLDSNVTINGDINGDGTPDITIDGQGASRDFKIIGGSTGFNPVALNGLTITGGSAYVDGGGISLKQGNYGPLDVTLSNSIITNNQAAYGGGISVEFNDILQVNNSVISGNNAAYVGGGIASKGSVNLLNTTVSGNSSGYIGGGVANASGLTAINSTISNNRIANGHGGPLYASAGAGLYNSGEANIVNTTISGNTGAYAGGGIYNSLGLFLVNATIANNSAYNGGGLANAPCGCGYAKLYDSTFTGNYAQQFGGGIYNAAGKVILTNNLVAGNSAGYQGPDLANGTSAITNYTGVNLFSQSGIGGPNDITQPDLTQIFANTGIVDPDGVPASGDEFEAGEPTNNGGPVLTVAIRVGGDAQDTGSTGDVPPDLFDLNHNGDSGEPLPVDARGLPRVSGSAVDIGAFEAQVQPPPSHVPFDLNGDANSDLVFQDNGQPGIWLMNAAMPIAEAGLGNPGASWRIITSRDLNGDGNADLIWQNSDGTPGIWLMNGTTPIAEAGLTNPGASWHIVASGDLNGDGKSDLVWQNTDGTLGVWLMNGTTPTAQAGIGNPGSNWKVVGSADFSGDGNDDILLQNTATGNLQIDVMNGTSVASTASITIGDPSWHAVSTGEFNGQAEIAWQNNNGTVGVWLMNGTSPAAEAALSNPGAGWQLLSVDHFTPNGQGDLLFQNTNGAMMLWEMNGGSVAAMVNLPNPTAAWQSVNGHPFAA
jgi:FG-GAP-like repeat